MPFDLAAMRGFVRMLIRDPSARAISDADLLDLYINPCWDEWFTRFERRPAGTISSITYTGNATFVAFGGLGLDPSARIENIVITTGSAQLIRQEWNRVRFLQESEGATGTPRTWAGLYTFVAGNFDFYFAVYPIPTVDTGLTLLGSSAPILAGFGLVADTDTVRTDPLAARWVARLAAYRAGLALNLDVQRLQSIASGLPQWVGALAEIDRLSHSRERETPDTPLHRKEPVNG